MSKSLGNVVKPDEVLAHFHGNPDPLRFYLSHEVSVGNDGDFSWKRIDELYDSKLRNQLGNLLNRVLVLMQKSDTGLAIDAKAFLGDDIHVRWHDYGYVMDQFDHVHLGLEEATRLVVIGNEYIDQMKVWTLEGEKKKEALSALAELLRHIALMLLPFIPDTAYRISKQLNVPYAEDMKSKDFVLTDAMKSWGGITEWTMVGEPSILFAPLEKTV